MDRVISVSLWYPEDGYVEDVGVSSHSALDEECKNGIKFKLSIVDFGSALFSQILTQRYLVTMTYSFSVIQLGQKQKLKNQNDILVIFSWRGRYKH